MKTLLLVLISFITFSCSKNENDGVTYTQIKQDNVKRKLSYLALGDSYTIGTSVKPVESFPYQLADSLLIHQIGLSPIKIIAQNGWTTDNLKSAIQQVQPGSYDIVTLLIGVNNQFQAGPIEKYESDFKELLDLAISFAGNKSHVFVLSIPDYGVTPFGNNNPEISKGVFMFNTVNKRISEQAGCNYVDITPISLLAKNDLSLLAQDQLHPSAKMYAMWVKELKKLLIKQYL